MTDPTSPYPPDTDAGTPQLKRLWLRSPVTPRVVMVAIALIGILLVFGAAVSFMVESRFAIIDRYGQELVDSRDMLSKLNALNSARVSIASQLLVRVDNAAPIGAPERQAMRATLEQAVMAINEQMAVLKKQAKLLEDQQAFQDLNGRLDAQATTLAELLDVADSGHNHKVELGIKQRIAAMLMQTDAVVERWVGRKTAYRSFMEKTLIKQLALVHRLVLMVLAFGSVVVLTLGWLLIRYIYKRDAVEQDLRRTMQLWTGTLNAIKKGVALFDKDRSLVLWNPTFAALHGVAGDALRAGMPVDELVALSRLAGDQLQKRKLRHYYNGNSRSPLDGEKLEFIRDDGVRIELAVYVMDAEYYVITLSDVSQVRNAEQLARDQAVRLGTIMNNVPDAIVTINTSGTIESWNAAAEKMFGYAASEIIRRNVSVLMSEPDASAHDSYLHRYLLSGEPRNLSQLREFSARRQDGSEFPVDVRISEMQLANRRMFVGIIRDITERRAIEQLKSEFIATVSHELRTPLTSIMGSLALIQQGLAGELPDRVRRLVVMAEKNSQRLGALINDVLDLEKAEAGRLSVSMERLALQPILEQSIDANRNYGLRFDVQLSLHAPVLPVMVSGDESRLMQVMANLLSNAIKHAPPHSQVLVEVTPLPDWVRITVHDEGPGVPEEFKVRVFQRFEQADGSDSRLVGGTGLGLAITKKLVELHGGQVGFTSGESLVGAGGGASFWFELPLANAAPTPTRPAVKLAMNMVLCAHDERIAAPLVAALQRAGCAVQWANHRGVVEPMLSEFTDVLLLDLDLPEENGLNLVSQLRAQPSWRSLALVVFSALPVSAGERAAHETLRISAWLEKPVDVEVLLTVLRQIKTASRREP